MRGGIVRLSVRPCGDRFLLVPCFKTRTLEMQIWFIDIQKWKHYGSHLWIFRVFPFYTWLLGIGRLLINFSGTEKWIVYDAFFPIKIICITWSDKLCEHVVFSWGALTHLESGFLVEIAQEALLQRNSNIQVDGSLRDWRWYQKVFKAIKKQYRKLAS